MIANISKRSSILLASAVGLGVLSAAPACAEEPSDLYLLSSFCDAANIKGATCTQTRNYLDEQGQPCDVKLSKDRYSGRFIAYGNRLLAVTYRSDCEVHATNFGGAAVFEEIAGKFVFRNFQRGATNHHCLIQVKSAHEDLLVCLTGYAGQGVVETGVARIVFTRDFSGDVSAAPDYFLTASDSVSAFGANIVNCKEHLKYFSVSRLGEGPRPQTVTAELSFADAATIRTACGKGFPKPKETNGELQPGEAYVPQGFEKQGKLVIDLVTRKIAPQ